MPNFSSTTPSLRFTQRLRIYSAPLLLAFLTACGGGGSGSSSSSGDPSSKNSQDLVIEGTAAVGAGLKGATISIRCSNGGNGIVDASVSTNSSDQPGHYQTLIKGAQLPCLLQVKGKDDQGSEVNLFGAALTQAGNSVVANLTPLTDAIMRSALSTDDLLKVFNNADSATLALLGKVDPIRVWNTMATTLSFLDHLTEDQLKQLKASNPLADVFLADGTGLDAILDVLGKAGVTSNQLASFVRYERFDANGVALGEAVSTKTWSDTGSAAQGTQWDCVRDRITGLTWEVKRPETTGLMAWRNKNHWHTWWRQVTFTSFEGTISNQAISYWNGDVEAKGLGLCNATLAACNTSAYLAKANQVGICGHKDWRLPTLAELGTLILAPSSSDLTGSMWMDRRQFPDQPDTNRDQGALMVWSTDNSTKIDSFGGGDCVDSQGKSTCLWSVNFSGYVDSNANRNLSTPMAWPAVVRLVRANAP